MRRTDLLAILRQELRRFDDNGNYSDEDVERAAESIADDVERLYG